MKYIYKPGPFNRGHNSLLPVYAGHIRGFGLGGLIRGLFKSAVPLLKPIAKTVGKSLLKTGGRIAKDVILDKKNFKSALKRRAGESLEDLVSKATAPSTKKRHKTTTSNKSRKKTKSKTKQKHKDIFQ